MVDLRPTTAPAVEDGMRLKAAAARETPSDNHPTSDARRADVLKVDSPGQISRDRSQTADRPGPGISRESVPAFRRPVRGGWPRSTRATQNPSFRKALISVLI